MSQGSSDEAKTLGDLLSASLGAPSKAPEASWTQSEITRLKALEYDKRQATDKAVIARIDQEIAYLNNLRVDAELGMQRLSAQQRAREIKKFAPLSDPALMAEVEAMAESSEETDPRVVARFLEVFESPKISKDQRKELAKELLSLKNIAEGKRKWAAEQAAASAPGAAAASPEPSTFTAAQEEAIARQIAKLGAPPAEPTPSQDDEADIFKASGFDLKTGQISPEALQSTATTAYPWESRKAPGAAAQSPKSPGRPISSAVNADTYESLSQRKRELSLISDLLYRKKIRSEEEGKPYTPEQEAEYQAKYEDLQQKQADTEVGMKQLKPKPEAKQRSTIMENLAGATEGDAASLVALGVKVGGITQLTRLGQQGISGAASFAGGKENAGVIDSMMGTVTGAAGNVASGAAAGMAVGGPAGAIAGAIIGAGATIATLPKAIMDWSESLIQSKRGIAQWNGALTQYFAEAEWRQIRRDIESGKRTSADVTSLGYSWQSLKDLLQPDADAITNFLSNATKNAVRGVESARKFIGGKGLGDTPTSERGMETQGQLDELREKSGLSEPVTPWLETLRRATRFTRAPILGPLTDRPENAYQDPAARDRVAKLLEDNTKASEQLTRAMIELLLRLSRDPDISPAAKLKKEQEAAMIQEERIKKGLDPVTSRTNVQEWAAYWRAQPMKPNYVPRRR